MAKNSKNLNRNWANDPPPKYYKGIERFSDWGLENIVPMEPGDILVNDDPEGDPYKLAYQGEDLPRPRNKKK